MPTSSLSSPSSFSLLKAPISASLPTLWLPYRCLNFLPESLTLQKQSHFRPNSSIATSKALRDNIFEECDIAKTKDKKIARFISRKVDVIVKLAENQEYLKQYHKKDLTQLLTMSYLALILIQAQILV